MNNNLWIDLSDEQSESINGGYKCYTPPKHYVYTPPKPHKPVCKPVVCKPAKKYYC